MAQAVLGLKTGIPLSTIKKYEGSHSEPGAGALAQLAKVDINPYWLVSGQGPMLLTVSRLGHARDAAVRFVSKRSSIPESRWSELQQAAFEKNLDEEGLEREFGANYPITSRAGGVDVTRLTRAIETVDKGLAQGDRQTDLPGRAELIATVYDMLEEPGDAARERVLKLLKLASH